MPHKWVNFGTPVFHVNSKITTMKKPLAIFALSVGLGLLTTQCAKQNVDPAVGEDISIPASFATTTSNFAFDFWGQLNKNTKPEENVFVSPLSLHMALGMLLNGADGKTKTEIQQVLGFNGQELDQINLIYQELIKNLPMVDSKVTNKMANSVWQRRGFTVRPEFLQVLNTRFNAQIFEEDFSNPATVNKINQWASDQTNKKITKVLEQITDEQVMFLMNALYFKGDWKFPFDKDRTFKTTFAGLTKQGNISLMNARHTVPYYQGQTFQAVELPYGRGQYAMTLILPNEGVSMSNFLNSFTADTWNTIRQNSREQKVEVGLPKFTMEYSVRLNEVLKAMGMPTVFTNQADLSKIAPPAGALRVGFVKQDTYLGVDEVGTEAAAVTTIGIELTSAPSYPTVFCDRPFILVIHEKSSNTIQFMGKIVNL